MSLTDFEGLGKLEKSAFATIFKVQHKSNRQLYVLKTKKLAGLSQSYEPQRRADFGVHSAPPML